MDEPIDPEDEEDNPLDSIFLQRRFVDKPR